ncbi:hypothetical protein ACFP65_08210 [Marinilactibacillus sp. GCM10026970]|uniref:hypothetical protein n=1 Tax=Marinilactibacillus sp. GCM10026970 TaxID=3252642 RepID=UPI00361BC338
MFKRYGNPKDLLATFTLEGLSDFILYLFDQENQDQLYETWLHKDQESNFQDFKKKHYKKINKEKSKQLTEQKEKEIIAESFKFIKPINVEGGE